MERYFVDSNVFLRYFGADDQKQKSAAASMFMKARAGQIELFCGPPVFFEVAWVLRSRYKISDGAILDAIESMLTIPNLCVFDSEYVKRAIAFARSKKRSYPDAYIAVVATDKNIGVATFNERHFDDMTLYPFAD